MTKNQTATVEKEAAPILSGPGGTRECPDWFQAQQREAWMQFESLPKPTRKDQAWRFANVGLLDLSPFKYGGTLTEKERATILEQSRVSAFAPGHGRACQSHGDRTFPLGE